MTLDAQLPSPASSQSPHQYELRHVTSNTFRSPRRTSQMLRTSDARMGSRSPNSIPSSPTSVHSSSSAIFERDIEPINPPSPPISSNPHRIPRAKTTEQLELSVPSVLDSAAAILTGIQDPEAGDQISVVTPASSNFSDHVGRSSGFASPIGSFRSRSPSPLGLRLGPGGAAGHRADLLLSIPPSNQPAYSMAAIATPPMSSSPQSVPLPLVPARPTIQTNVASTPSIVTPTSVYFTTSSSMEDESSSTATSHDNHEHQHHAVSTVPMVSPPPLTAVSSPFTSSTTSHPPSPTHAASKRLSFMSYSDLLTSTPASTLPLSFLTTSASTVDPPPHIPSVSGLTQMNSHSSPSAATSLRGFALHGNGKGRRDSVALSDDVGGEFEREGFGKGLEEQLEAMMPPVHVPVGQKA
ncbi:hypothetical protein AX17_007085 [Amanita inopinata Kibby_2008]|nr:hypothetical protein AX17_007085 [Amanita inopinata Kibby_2008]